MQTLVSLSSALIGIAIVCYLAAIVIALVLGVPGFVHEEYALVPLAVGGFALGLGIAGEVAGGK
ncbi:MAG TPA: hypothetical protein VE777_16450 [Gaiellales bacterium]|nr:hypothetical protein [Gaiellales bacterium]